ncbi:MAG: sortase [Ilumatobacteraceae bacterium]
MSNPLAERGLSRRRLLGLAAAAPILSRLHLLSDADPLTWHDRWALSLAAPAIPEALANGASVLSTVAPYRLVDTRTEPSAPFGFQRLDANTIRVRVAGDPLPSGAVAAVLNVTMTNPSGPGFVSVYPSGEPRGQFSSINVERPGQTLANLVTVRLGVDGSVDMYCLRPADLIVDVSGAYVPVGGAVSAGRFVGLAKARRVFDSRERGWPVAPGVTERVSLTNAAVPTTASAVVVNLTVTETAAAGYWTGFASGRPKPNSSNLNTDAAGQTRANQAILPISGLAAIDVFSQTGGHLIVDVAGYFTGSTSAASSDGLFVPSSPKRTIDTREVPAYGRMYPGWVCEMGFDGQAAAQAAVINLTTTETRGAGFFTAYPARTDRPVPASNLNATNANQTIANHAIVATSTTGLAVYTQSGGAVIADVAGYYTGRPVPSVYAPTVNVVPPPAALPYTMTIPKLGLVRTVYEGVGTNVVDGGFIGHWPGTGLCGELNHMVLFAHRTEHGGPLRNVHLIGPGDEVIFDTADGRRFRYGYWNRTITTPSATAIYEAGLGSPAPNMSLVACSKTNYLPTDTNYRIVVNFTQLD